MMSSHLPLTWEWHLEQVYHVFSHLRKYHNSDMVFDTCRPITDEANFCIKDWTSSEFGHVQG